MTELMQRRRALMGARKKSRLPAEYQEVEWISNGDASGSAFIDTGIYPHRTTTTCVFSNMRFSLGGQIFGCWNPRNNRYYGLRLNASYFCYVNRNNTNTQIQTWDELKHMIVFNGENQSVLFDGVEATNGGSLDLLSKASHSIYLFGNNDEDILKNTAPVRIHEIFFLDKDTASELGHFYPCYRKSDMAVGMYDTVSETFFANAGSGLFTKGEIIG